MPNYSDTNYNLLFSKIYTIDDLNLFLVELTELKNSIYKLKGDTWETTLTTKVRSEMATEIQKLLAQGMDKQKLIEELELAAKNLKVLELTVAFQPSIALIGKIFSWVKANLGDGVILKLNFDPVVLGGAQLMFNGRFVDLTLKKLLDGYFESQESQSRATFD